MLDRASSTTRTAVWYSIGPYLSDVNGSPVEARWGENCHLRRLLPGLRVMRLNRHLVRHRLSRESGARSLLHLSRVWEGGTQERPHLL